MKRKNVLIALSLCVLPLTFIAGCDDRKKESVISSVSGGVEDTMENRITAVEIVTSYNEKGFDNYKMHISYDQELEMQTEEESVCMTSKIITDSIRAGKYVYEVQTLSMQNALLDTEDAWEVYNEIDENKVTGYFSELGQNDWYVSETESMQDSDIFMVDPEDFKNASVTEDKKAGTYTVKVLIADLSDRSYYFLHNLKSTPVEEDDCLKESIRTVINDGKHFAFYTFSKADMRLLSIDYDQIEASVVVGSDRLETRIIETKDVSVKFSDYGKIKEKTVKAPKKIKSSAKEWHEEY